MARRDAGHEPISLEQIIAEVAGQRRLRGKASVVARRWREVRALDPDERERVAAALGSQAAWRQLEAYFDRDGTISDSERWVKRTFDRLAADPARVREVVSRARSGDYRSAAAGAVEILTEDAIEQPGNEDESIEPAGGGRHDDRRGWRAGG